MCLNAGVGHAGRFDQSSLEDDLRLIDLNVHSAVHLAKEFSRAMVTRGEGRMLFTSSVASQMPGPGYATYAASKAFVQSFAEALRADLAETGVSVTALLPGPTDTEFFDRADMAGTKVDEGAKDDPAEVAREGFEALMAGKDQMVAGSLTNRLQKAASRVLPDAVKARVHGSMLERKDDQ